MHRFSSSCIRLVQNTTELVRNHRLALMNWIEWLQHALVARITANGAIALAATIFVLSVIWICFTARVAPPCHAGAQFNPALLKLVAPTRSLWPARYCSSSYRASVCVRLGFGTLLRDLCAGIIELRSPNASVRSLLQSCQLGTDNIISLHMELYMWMSAAWFLFKHELLLQHYQKPINVSFDANATASTVPSPTIGEESASEIGAIFLLDSCSRHQLGQYIHDISLAIPVGKTTRIHLTTTSSSRPSLMSRQAVLLCMILAQSHLPFNPGFTFNTAPLFLCLSRVLALIATRYRPDSPVILVEGVRKISASYAQDLVSPPVAIGPQWRKERLMRQLQSEAYSLGWMDRWEITVRRIAPKP